MKYLHIMADNFYTKSFIELVQSNFDTEEHQFIIFKHKNKKMYLNPEKYQNLKLFTFTENFLMRFFTINKYTTIRNLMKQAEIIFIHYLTDEISGILFRFKGKVKTLWVIWGADLYEYLPLKLYDQHTSELLSKLDSKIKSILNRMYNSFYHEIRKAVIKNLDYVISSHKGDYRLLKKYYNTKAKCYSIVIYPNPVDFEKIEKEVDSVDEKFNFNKNGVKLLLIGNSGTPTNNHLDIMIRLSEMKEQNFKIICPLSYGSPIYIKKIIENGKNLFGDRFIPLCEFLKPNVYFNILKQIDLAIMHHNRQQGVGTLNLLLYLGKPLCMKKTSSFFHLLEKDVSVFPTKDLEKLTGNEIEFTEVMAEKNRNIITKNHSVKSVISSIKTLLSLLGEKDN